MAYLEVAPHLITEALFKDGAPGVRIVGASFDPFLSVVVLEIEGASVPDVDRVRAICSVERLRVRFEPIV